VSNRAILSTKLLIRSANVIFAYAFLAARISARMLLQRSDAAQVVAQETGR